MAITAALVKELREITSAGMMDCKKALTATDGDIDKAIDWLRQNGITKAAKKANRISAEGLSKVVVEGNKAVILEVNSETDFVAKNEHFLEMINKIAAALLNSDAKTVEEANNLTVDGTTVAELVINATATIGEKISFRRFEIVEKSDNDAFGAYMHMGGKISVLTLLTNTNNAEVAKNIAMQVCSMNPSYITMSDITPETVEHETAVQTELVKNDESLANKPEKVLAGIISGRVNKTFKEQCLENQEFFLDSSMTCAQYLKNNGTAVAKFIRYQVGEGIEKREENFAEEVAKSMNV